VNQLEIKCTWFAYIQRVPCRESVNPGFHARWGVSAVSTTLHCSAAGVTTDCRFYCASAWRCCAAIYHAHSHECLQRTLSSMASLHMIRLRANSSLVRWPVTCSMQASAALPAAVHWKFQFGTMNPGEGLGANHDQWTSSLKMSNKISNCSQALMKHTVHS